ncbi:hypothetical protein [Snodgrassella gandavensis]|uniref:hypothetical protein n=1 Tax=Snodgrassella gandavensis TaxID=2946698 RepID=UPI001EF6303E|nr:hypothetical protein [Snodgrassella gandavensis]
METINKYYYYVPANETKFCYIKNLLAEYLPASKIDQLRGRYQIGVDKFMYKQYSRIVLLLALEPPAHCDITITDDYIQPYRDYCDSIADKNFICGLWCRESKVCVEIIPKCYRLLLCGERGISAV